MTDQYFNIPQYAYFSDKHQGGTETDEKKNLYFLHKLVQYGYLSVKNGIQKENRVKYMSMSKKNFG
jgi:hypothetical protein